MIIRHPQCSMAELPPVVARMWGREPTTRRGPRPRLDLATITAAAIEIADTEGLAAVSMSSVAAQVGVAPMALYRYVGSKDELLTVMADSALPPPPASTSCWTARGADHPPRVPTGRLTSAPSTEPHQARRPPPNVSPAAVLFSEVPSWGFASQPCVFSEVVAVSASENTIFSEVR
jgi:hypothetical protein